MRDDDFGFDKDIVYYYKGVVVCHIEKVEKE